MHHSHGPAAGSAPAGAAVADPGASADPGAFPEPATPHAGHRSWAVLGLMLLAQFMVILDISVVNVALPSIGRALGFTSGDYQWAVSAYVLLSGGFLLLGGRLADLFDRRAVFLTGLALFTAASLASGLSGSALSLALARGGQGLGAALLTPAALSVIMSAYAGRQRTVALSVWGTIGSTGIAAGVLFGGALTSALGWRAVFFINVPIGLLVALGTLLRVERGSAAAGPRRLDLPGALSLVAGLLVLVGAIEQTSTSGWASARTWLLLGTAAGLLAGFALIERHAATPLVPPRAWRIRSLVSASAVMAGVTGAVVGVIFLSSLYLQRVLGSSAVEAGLQVLPLALAITAAAAVASKVVGRTSPRTLIAGGLVVMAAGAALLAVGSGGGYLAAVLPGFLVVGAGVGPMFVAISVAAMSDVDPSDAGVASGLMMTGHEVGAALGVAVLSTVAGDLVTRNGLVAGTGRAFTAVVVVLGALLVLAVAAMPRGRAPAPAHGGHHPH